MLAHCGALGVCGAHNVTTVQLLLEYDRAVLIAFVCSRNTASGSCVLFTYSGLPVPRVMSQTHADCMEG
jgi:hypothetical protein